jgi:hypothetical protein
MTSDHYLPSSESFQIAKILGGGAAYLPLSDVPERPSPQGEFITIASKVIDSILPDLIDEFDIKFVIFVSNSISCFATKISEKSYVLCISDLKIFEICHVATYFYALKEMRQFLGLETGDSIFSFDENFLKTWEMSGKTTLERMMEPYDLWACALRFLVCHEISHIINGHLDFKYAAKKKGNLLTNIQSKALECDADSFATHHLSDMLEKTASFFKNVRFENNQTLLNCVAIVVAVVFYNSDYDCLFDQEKLKSGNTHPSGFARFCWCMSSFCSNRIKKGYEFAENEEIENTSLTILNMIFFENSKSSPDEKPKDIPEENFDYHWSNVMGYVKEIEKSWNEIRSDLDNLKIRKSDIAPINPWAET